MEHTELRPVFWTGSSREVLKTFPVKVRDRMGYALYLAQLGRKHRDAKVFKNLGSGVLEIVTRHDGDTYRAVYTVHWPEAVYVLHAFQKKARQGRKTPRHDVELIRQRLKAAKRHYEINYGKGRK